MSKNTIISSLYGELEISNLQVGVSKHQNPGILYIPPGKWESNIVIAQHNLTLVGAGENTILESENDQPPVTIIAPNVRLVNLAIRNEFNTPAVAYTHGSAPQGILQNVTILESGSHGVLRSNGRDDRGSAINSILDCDFRNIDGDGIVAESGSGPQNLVRGNRGENINGSFIRWGVNASLLLDNWCEDAAIHLTQESGDNFVQDTRGTEIRNEDESNRII